MHITGAFCLIFIAMQITWHGLNCLRLEGKEAALLTDPFTEKSGLKLPRSKTDIVTVSGEGLAADDVSGEPFIIDVPGEYEKMGVFVYGLPWKQSKSESKSVLFRVNMDDISFAHIAAADKPLTPDVLETLEGVDVLCLPTEETALSPKDAAEIINQIEPRVVVLMGDKPQALLKEAGAKAETVDKLKLIKKDLPTDDRRFYIIERS